MPWLAGMAPEAAAASSWPCWAGQTDRQTDRQTLDTFVAKCHFLWNNDPGKRRGREREREGGKEGGANSFILFGHTGGHFKTLAKTHTHCTGLTIRSDTNARFRAGMDVTLALNRVFVSDRMVNPVVWLDMICNFSLIK